MESKKPRLESASNRLLFEFFNEVGIISQLSSALLNRSLPEGLHVAHFSLLNHMVRLGDGKTPQQLASAFQVTKSTMTHSLQVLEERGFIEFLPHPEDRRSKLVFLTARGRSFREEAIAALSPRFGELKHYLDVEAISGLLEDLRRIRKALDEHR